LARECLEEIGCAVTVGDLACERDYIGATHEFAAHDGWFHQRETYFWCTLADGAEPANGPGADDYQVGVRWIPLDELADHPIAPRHLAGWFAAPESERPRYLGDVN
jgi:8-oxo-dGTP pyrophosphatase MutT (NUDIX family)